MTGIEAVGIRFGAVAAIAIFLATFVVTKDGRIAHKHIGQLTDKDLERTVLPLVERLRRQ